MNLTVKHIINNYDKYLNNDIIVSINGWIKTFRQQKDTSFIQLNDGSCLTSIQVVYESSNFNLSLSTGCCINVIGYIVSSPLTASEQSFELSLKDIKVYGYNLISNPIAKTKLGIDFLRTIPHLRHRTNTFSAISRIRHNLSFSTHKYFNDNGYLLINPPQITSNDCEGGGEAFKLTSLNIINSNNKNYDDDFFKTPAYLTVSGQLGLECFCLGLGPVYSFQNAFRADPSQTTRHVAEFIMLEIEVPFIDLNDLMDIATKYIKYVIKYILDNCFEDIRFLSSFYYEKKKNGRLEEYLQNIIDNDFINITYEEALNILREEQNKNPNIFEIKLPLTGSYDLKSCHERYLTDIIYKKPIFITHYPRDIKAFYMEPSLQYDNCVNCCDLLLPNIGEVLGGSIRNSNYESLKEIMTKHNIVKGLEYYLELRQLGCAPHGGFGIGISRLMMLITGMDNIRDMIEIPRTIGSLEY